MRSREVDGASGVAEVDGWPSNYVVALREADQMGPKSPLAAKLSGCQIQFGQAGVGPRATKREPSADA